MLQSFSREKREEVPSALHTPLRPPDCPMDLHGFETALFGSSLCQVGTLGGKCPEQRSEEAHLTGRALSKSAPRPRPEGGRLATFRSMRWKTEVHGNLCGA